MNIPLFIFNEKICNKYNSQITKLLSFFVALTHTQRSIKSVYYKRMLIEKNSACKLSIKNKLPLLLYRCKNNELLLFCKKKRGKLEKVITTVGWTLRKHSVISLSHYIRLFNWLQSFSKHFNQKSHTL